jgi:hypothetical protein
VFVACVCVSLYTHTHTHKRITDVFLHNQWKGGFDLEAKNAAESDAELETLQVCVRAYTHMNA